jgi:agmatine deiminase
MSEGLRPRPPAAEGFWMPAEYEAHEGTWLLWPARHDNWRERARPAQAAFTQVASAIRRFERVHVGVMPHLLADARAMLPHDIEVHGMEYDDCWMRDVGPTFVVGEERQSIRAVHWRFNAWGGLYHPFDRDERVPLEVLARSALPMRDRYRSPIVLEGGGLHVDGEGTALLTEECALDPNRNPGMTRERMEAVLREYLGVSHFIWLGKGVYNDETTGHIDNLACFAAPGKVCLTWTDDESDPQHAISLDAWKRLSDARDAQGRRLQVLKLPMPGPLHMTDDEARGLTPSESMKPRRAGDRLAASYVNFYFANGAIIMPLLDPLTDEQAAAVLRKACPGRQIVGVPAREILLGGGGIHCITQQIPRWDLARKRLRPSTN